jgi:signal transduction histidine kinase
MQGEFRNTSPIRHRQLAGFFHCGFPKGRTTSLTVMFERSSLKWPITLGVVMILLVLVLAVGWVLLSIFGAIANSQRAGLYWGLLSAGTVILAAVLAGVIAYLTISIQAINLSRRQSNFIDSVTHELKSPIASLKLYLQTLNRRHVSPEQRESFQRYMIEDVERLDQLINHLLDAARVERGRKSAEPSEPTRFDLVLRESLPAVCVRHQVDQETLTLELTPALVRSPAADLAIIGRNLVDNALKYGGRPPEVRVVLEAAGPGKVALRVIDNGPGVPRSMRRSIFGRFVRLGSELERESTGTGLGLFLVRTLVHRLRGEIRVRDRRDRPGSEFEVVLPGELALDPESDSPSEALESHPLE